MDTPTQEGVTKDKLVGQQVKIANPELLGDPLQVNVDVAQDVMTLEGMPEANLDMENAAQAIQNNLSEFSDFVDDNDNKIGPINVPSEAPLAADNDFGITHIGENNKNTV